jgi:hypothetical protein
MYVIVMYNLITKMIFIFVAMASFVSMLLFNNLDVCSVHVYHFDDV